MEWKEFFKKFFPLHITLIGVPYIYMFLSSEMPSNIAHNIALYRSGSFPCGEKVLRQPAKLFWNRAGN